MSATLQPERLFEVGLPAADSVRKLDQQARDTFAEVPQDPPLFHGPASSSVDPAIVLTRSAEYLELWRALAGIAEAVSAVGARTVAEVQAHAREIFERASLLTQIEVQDVILSSPVVIEAAGRTRTMPEPDDAFPLVESAAFVRVLSSLIEFCPITELESVGEQVHRPDLGHRCRLSYDWLRAYIRRKRPGERETLHILGQAYAEGRLSLSDAAHLLSMPRSDAVAWLEECGYARALEVIQMSPSDREGVLQLVREERQARDGRPILDADRVVRDVIATQRIEDVDARRWLHRSA